MVYLIRKRALGDVLWIEPIVREMINKKKKLTLYTKFPELFAHFPSSELRVKSDLNFLEKLIIRFWPRKLFGLEVINLDMAYEKDPKKHFLFAYQEACGIPVHAEYPRLYLSEEEKNIQFPFKKPFVVLHLETFSQKKFRNVYGIDWGQIVSYLISLGYEVVQIGKSQTDIPGTKKIKTSSRELIALINHSEFFIGIDSGPGHIATALQKPCLLFFGAVNPHFRHFSNIFKGFFLQQSCEYSGCYHEEISTSGPKLCKLVGTGQPPCCIHTNDYLKKNIDKLIATYL